MRVLIVTQYFWPEVFRINDLALGLRERGHDVTVFTGKPNYPEGRFFPGYGFFGRATEDYHGVRVIRAPLLPRGGGGRVSLFFNFASFALFGSLLAPLRCGGRYDAILVYEPSPVTVGLPALVLKRVKHSPVLFWAQDLWPETLSATGAVRAPWVLSMVDRLVRFIYRHCDLVLVQSRAFAPHVQAQGVPAEKIRYYPNSAEALYRAAAVEPQAPERGLLPPGFRVMFAGNIGAAQDFETILAAAERLRAERGIHWVIVGDGRRQPWVEAEIGRRDLGATVHLLGRHPVESMPRFFALADALLVTLRNEPIFSLTIPTKIQSYLACGRPIVAALDGEGARVVRESGAGLAVRAGTAGALADAVLRLHRMPAAEREAMGRRGREYFEAHFERSMLLSRLEQWMLELARPEMGNRK
ncbi:MAG TPA: glycosyltransferase family 4 protein [Burkholderiales bacterium]|nr:glycosyltransferase family 4 protein [Burkholderiales bacterium]